MKKTVISAALFCLVSLYAAPASATEAQGGAGSIYHFLVLTPGHSQTLFFELNNTVFNDHSQFHTFYCITVGEGTLNLRVGPASSVGQFAGMVYATAGFLGLQPIAQYGYNAETISVNATMPAVGAGIMFTAITVGTGKPDYPIVMSMVVSLIQ